MAENKKKVVVYSDWISNFEELTDLELGQLMRHFFDYINDKNPILEDRCLKIAWKPIENTLKRDLKSWEDKAPKRSDKARIAGLASAEARRVKKELDSTTKLPLVENELNSTKSTVSVSVSVSDTVSDSVIFLKETDVNNSLETKTIKDFTEEQFLQRWKDARMYYDKHPTYISELLTHESINFKKIKRTYTGDQIQQAIQGLFKQDTFKSIRLRPSHFLNLEHFEKYLTCFDTKEKLFPKINKQQNQRI